MAHLMHLAELSALEESGVVPIADIVPLSQYVIPQPPLAYGGAFSVADLAWAHNFCSGIDAVSPAVSIYKISGCMVSVSGAVMTRSGALIAESAYPYVRPQDIANAFGPGLSLDADAVDFGFNVRAFSQLSEPLLYGRDHGEEGYFHWLHSVLPRVAAYRQAGLAHRLLVALTKPFQSASLHTMGVSSEQCLVSTGATYLCDELYFCSPMVVPDLTRSGGFFERALYATDVLRSFAASTTLGKASRAIYISRGDASIRRFSSEVELVRQLASVGIETVTLSGMDFKDQVRLFSECALVIGAHGAGLSNVSLMPQGAQVVEVLSPRRLWPTYRGVAARSGVRYYPYVAASVGTETTNDSDIDVNIDHLLGFVNRVRQTGVSA